MDAYELLLSFYELADQEDREFAVAVASLDCDQSPVRVGARFGIDFKPSDEVKNFLQTFKSSLSKDRMEFFETIKYVLIEYAEDNGEGSLKENARGLLQSPIFDLPDKILLAAYVFLGADENGVFSTSDISPLLKDVGVDITRLSTALKNMAQAKKAPLLTKVDEDFHRYSTNEFGQKRLTSIFELTSTTTTTQ